MRNEKKKKKRIINPLIKRVPKELIGEWRKYLVIFLLLSMTIGFVSGMYVANHSMLISIDRLNHENKLEDGHFELEEKASDEFIMTIESGEKVDLRAYFIDEAHKEIDEKIEEIRQKAVRIYKLLGCSGLTRVDFFVRKSDGEVMLNELNTIPGFTSISMYPKLFAASGIEYPELIDRLIRYALEN